MQIFSQIAYYQVGRLPLIAVLGIITLTFFLATASIPFIKRKNILKIPYEWHPRMAKISIALGIIHGFLALATYLF